MKQLKIGLALFTYLLLSGCAGNLYLPVHYMAKSHKQENIEAPVKGMAQIVFARNQTYGWMFTAALFEIIDGQPVLINVLPNERKVVYQVKPGKHTFMVTGETTDFLVAEDMQASQTYYSLVITSNGNLCCLVYTSTFFIKSGGHNDQPCQQSKKNNSHYMQMTV